jgi:hypothetical protein
MQTYTIWGNEVIVQEDFWNHLNSIFQKSLIFPLFKKKITKLDWLYIIKIGNKFWTALLYIRCCGTFELLFQIKCERYCFETFLPLWQLWVSASARFYRKIKDLWKNKIKTYDYKKTHNQKGKTNKALTNPILLNIKYCIKSTLKS